MDLLLYRAAAGPEDKMSSTLAAPVRIYSREPIRLGTVAAMILVGQHG